MNTTERVFFRFAAILAVSGLCAGCENNGGSKSLGEGYDFGNNDPNLVVCIGDSITKGNAVPGLTPYPALLGPMIGKSVENRGQGGAMTDYGVEITPGILANRKPGFLIIDYGAVDAIFDRDQAWSLNNLRTIIRMATANKTIPILATLTPQIGEHRVFNHWVDDFNPQIRDLANAEGAALADIADGFADPESLLVDDGLHPNQAGEQLMATLFADVF
jgi:lysophospholipase L1-like esterase